MSGKVNKKIRKLQRQPLAQLIKAMSRQKLESEFLALTTDYENLIDASDALHSGALRMRRVFWAAIIPLSVLFLASVAINIMHWVR